MSEETQKKETAQTILAELHAIEGCAEQLLELPPGASRQRVLQYLAKLFPSNEEFLHKHLGALPSTRFFAQDPESMRQETVRNAVGRTASMLEAIARNAGGAAPGMSGIKYGIPHR